LASGTSVSIESCIFSICSLGNQVSISSRPEAKNLERRLSNRIGIAIYVIRISDDLAAFTFDAVRSPGLISRLTFRKTNSSDTQQQQQRQQQQQQQP
jgi:hypothetical protein